ncbi:MAG: aspartate/glutamate racemase family protein [Anaerolineales bacterium]|nr:aspartate/glutamate racemase family protein [Anaerolineales bacterium]
MKTIGLIGGMSWESSLEYYRIINESIKEKLGGLHSAKLILYSVDFAEIEALQQAGDWGAAARHMVAAGQSLEKAGADFIVLCTNTMHLLAGDIRSQIRIPFLHIAEAAGRAVRAAGMQTVGLLGTRFTMENDFITRRLAEKFGLKILVPEPADRESVHRIIFEEICRGILMPESRRLYLSIIDDLAHRGAQGVILGCTEIELLVRPEDTKIPLFPTTRIHALAAVEYAVGGAEGIVE